MPSLVVAEAWMSSRFVWRDAGATCARGHPAGEEWVSGVAEWRSDGVVGFTIYGLRAEMGRMGQMGRAGRSRQSIAASNDSRLDGRLAGIVVFPGEI